MITSIGYYEAELKIRDTLVIGIGDAKCVCELIGIGNTRIFDTYELRIRKVFQQGESFLSYNIKKNEFKDGRKIICVNGKLFKVRNTLEVELI